MLIHFTPMIFQVIEKAKGSSYILMQGSNINCCTNIVLISLKPSYNLRVQGTAEPVSGASKEFMAFGGGLRLCVLVQTLLSYRWLSSFIA